MAFLPYSPMLIAGDCLQMEKIVLDFESKLDLTLVVPFNSWMTLDELFIPELHICSNLGKHFRNTESLSPAFCLVLWCERQKERKQRMKEKRTLLWAQGATEKMQAFLRTAKKTTHFYDLDRGRQNDILTTDWGNIGHAWKERSSISVWKKNTKINIGGVHCCSRDHHHVGQAQRWVRQSFIGTEPINWVRRASPW